MTKIGEGSNPAEPQGVKEYRAEFMKSTHKFQDAMRAYLSTDNKTEQEHLQTMMAEQLELIQAAVRELRMAGLGKENVQLQADYKKFIDDPTGENKAALAQDIETLREHVGAEEPPPSFGLRG